MQPGLTMGMGGRWGAGGGSNSGAQSSQPAPASIGQAAWGPSYGSGSKVGGGLLSALMPNDAFGIAHLSGLVATGFLVWLYWTLPN